MERNLDVIPSGMYCYEWKDGDIDENGEPRKSTCPYWELREDHEEQDNGYCHFLGEGDWDVDGLSLLWDQCKECGENWGDDSEWL